MVKYTEANFHLPRPKPPSKDLRWYSLIVPPVCFSIGMVLFGLLGFSFVELRDMPALLRSNIVVTGSIGLAIGSELGTLPALLEVFRKVGAKRAGVWDWIGLGVSVLTSVTILIMSWAWLLQIDVTWSETIRVYGPLLLGSLAILDFTASGVEAGLYLATYDERFTRWQTDLEDWLIQMNGRDTTPQIRGGRIAPTAEDLEMADKAVITTSGGPQVWTDIHVSNEPCWCGWQQSGIFGDLTPEAHAAMHRIQAMQFESAGEALNAFKKAYDTQRWTIQGSHSKLLPSYPTVLEIVKWREEE